jgi:H+/Cl- antiporter ClcA
MTITAIVLTITDAKHLLILLLIAVLVMYLVDNV